MTPSSRGPLPRTESLNISPKWRTGSAMYPRVPNRGARGPDPVRHQATYRRRVSPSAGSSMLTQKSGPSRVTRTVVGKCE